MTNKFTSIGKDRNFSGPNCAFFIAGILEGFLKGASLTAKVTPVIHAPDPEASETSTDAAGGRDNPYAAGADSGAN